MIELTPLSAKLSNRRIVRWAELTQKIPRKCWTSISSGSFPVAENISLLLPSGVWLRPLLLTHEGQSLSQLRWITNEWHPNYNPPSIIPSWSTMQRFLKLATYKHGLYKWSAPWINLIRMGNKQLTSARRPPCIGGRLGTGDTSVWRIRSWISTPWDGVSFNVSINSIDLQPDAPETLSVWSKTVLRSRNMPCRQITLRQEWSSAAYLKSLYSPGSHRKSWRV